MIRTFFEQISSIPRASYNEGKVSDFLVEFAKERNLRFIQDEKKNVIIFKDATAGYEDHPVVMLQGHMDMVAEKNQDSNHDFEKDSIEIIEKDGWLYANKTTLGADDGAGVVYMMAILDDNSLKHPPLECVFTVEEEVGMGGAIHLDTSVLQAKRLIGLDSSGENSITTSSTGGNRGVVTYDFKYERSYKHQLIIKVRGLKGGHSGVEIDQERANAAKVMGKLLVFLKKDLNFGFSSINGGLKDNAIMRECDCVIGVKEEDIGLFTSRIEELETEFKKMYAHADDRLRIEWEVKEKDCYTTSVEDTIEFSNLLALLPYGYFQKSKVVEGLVIASSNIGRVESDESQVRIGLSMRAPLAFTLSDINQQVAMITELCNGSVEFTDGYPGWQYDEQSELRDIVNAVYQELNEGESMVLEATHGGLELGIWKDRMPEIDIVAFGPIMEDIHTPDERLNLDSFYRVYSHLVRVLKRL